MSTVKRITLIALVMFGFISLQSCYTTTYAIGSGSKNGNTVVCKKNHFLINGIVPIAVSNPQKMARSKDAENYDIVTSHSFVDGLIAGFTLRIYTPTTTCIVK